MSPVGYDRLRKTLGAIDRGSSRLDGIKSRGMWRLRWTISSGFWGKARTLVDFAGDLVVAVSASIAAGSGLSALRLLRRLNYLEKELMQLHLLEGQNSSRIKDLRRRYADQAIFNAAIEDKLDELADKPAPKQHTKMGTPRPNSASGFLYGRTQQGPQDTDDQ